MKISTLLVVIPVIALATVVAVANRAPVTFSLDPFSPDTPSVALTLPLFLIVFLVFFLGVVLGGMTVWLRRAFFSRVANPPQPEKLE